MPFELTLYSILYGTVGTSAFLLGLFILLKNPKSKLNRLYFFFCQGIVLWMIPNSISNPGLCSDSTALILSKIVFSSIVFLPTIALHFAIEYLNEKSEKIHKNLRIAYLFTFIFFGLLWATDNFITGLNQYEWGAYPKGGFIHGLHSIFVITTAIYMVWLLWRGVQKVLQEQGKSKKYYETKYVFIAYLFITISTVDFLPSWGVNVFPFGFIFVTIFIVATGYAIFKHEFFGISFVIQKSLVYSILISLITATYFLSVYSISSFVGSIVEIHSFSLTLLIFAIITLLFRPMERRVQRIVDTLFFKRPIEVIEKENTALLQKLQEQERMKAVATLAAGMAHEIKNPLTAIKTFTEYLPSKSADPDFLKKYQKIVGSEVTKIDQIVKQLLEFSKPTPPRLETINFVEVISDTLHLLEAEFVKHQIEMNKQFAADIIWIKGDKKQLQQAFLNLLLNSIQAMPSGGKLTLSIDLSSNPDNSVKVFISDTGCGIPKENLAHIFDPFFTTKEEGTGLGLAITHGILKEHRCKIGVKSAKGGGTTFILQFPTPSSPELG